MKHLNEKTVRYMGAQWGFDWSDSHDDTRAAWDLGLYELVAIQLVEAGAVEGICQNSKAMLDFVASVSEKERTELIETLIEQTYTHECLKCNAVQFHPKDSLYPASETINWPCYCCARSRHLTKGRES